jgi:hypothetical protein
VQGVQAMEQRLERGLDDYLRAQVWRPVRADQGRASSAGQRTQESMQVEHTEEGRQLDRVAHSRLDDSPRHLHEAQEATDAEITRREAQNYSRAEAQLHARIIRNLVNAHQQQQAPAKPRYISTSGEASGARPWA